MRRKAGSSYTSPSSSSSEVAEHFCPAWLKAEWTTSDTGRQVRSYRITSKGQKQLETEQDDYQRMADAIAAILNHV